LLVTNNYRSSNQFLGQIIFCTICPYFVPPFCPMDTTLVEPSETVGDTWSRTSAPKKRSVGARWA